METKKKWYQSTGGIIALLILFFPIGLYLMWKHATWNKAAKWAVTGVFAFVVLLVAADGNKSPSTTSNTQSSTPSLSQETKTTAQPKASDEQQTQKLPKAPAKATANTQAPAQTKQPAPATPAPATPAPATNVTVSQQNAVKSAKSYLNFSSFSRDGLVAQLEFEKFSHEDAVYGADNAGANWNEQAAKSAKSYMNMSGYSRDGLIAQLKFEKFTQEQAEYGAKAVGL